MMSEVTGVGELHVQLEVRGSSIFCIEVRSPRKEISQELRCLTAALGESAVRLVLRELLY
jgi:hypothetical protein